MTIEEIENRKRALVTSRNTHIGNTAINGAEIGTMFLSCQSLAEYKQHGVKDFRVPTPKPEPYINTHRPKKFVEKTVSLNGKRYKYYQDVTKVPIVNPIVSFGTLADTLNGKRLK